MPEETGKLEIYSSGNEYSSLLNPAIEILKDLYPEIEVSYTILSADEFETRIRTEIPAGGGPDLVLMADGTFRDIYKTMQTDLFEDLNPYFGTDEEIALSDFVKPVMDGGILNGKRYLAPLNYELPVYLTTQAILDEVGVPKEGRLVSLITPGRAKLFGLLGREDDYVLPWTAIVRIGSDIILVDMQEECRRRKRPRRGWL